MGFNVDGLVEGLGIFYYVLVYGVGICAMASAFISYQFERRATILLFNYVAQMLWITYFLLQADVSSAIACAITSLALITYSRKGKWKWVSSKITLAVCVLIIAGTTLTSFRVWSDILPVLGSTCAVLSYSRTKENELRALSLACYLFWFCNSLFKMYPVALISDFTSITSVVISLIRYRKKAKKIVENSHI